MTFIPEEELKDRGGLTLAPMIDFLFLMLAVFASLAVSRMVTKDTEIELVKSTTAVASSKSPHEYKLVHLTISADGSYRWVTEVRDYAMESADHIAQELMRQYNQGLLPKDKLKTQVLVKIDKETKWEPILKVILAIKEIGFEIRPVYEPTNVLSEGKLT
jgi:biopolymer transport protein ExbD